MRPHSFFGSRAHPGGVVGFDCDGDELHAAELRLAAGGPCLVAARSMRVAGEVSSRGELLSTYLLEMLREGGFRAAAGAMAVPRAGAVARVLDLPPLKAESTGLAAAAALEDQLPFPPSELCLGWRRQAGSRVVRAAAARRAAVEECRAAMTAAGLSPSRVDVRPLAAAAALHYWHGGSLGNRTAVLLELRRAESALICLRKGEVTYSRALPGLGEEPAAGLPGLAAELSSSLAILRARPDWDDPGCLWLAGICAADAEVRRTLAGLLGLAPEACRAASIPVAEGSRFVQGAAADRFGMGPEAPRELGPEMLVPIGLCLGALGLADMGPDLLPGLSTDKRTRHPFLSLAVPLGLTVILALGGLRFLAAAGRRRMEVRRAWLSANAGRIAALERLQAETASQARSFAHLDGYGKESAAYLDFLLALDQALPAETIVTRLSLAGGRVQTLEGYTPSVSVLLRRLKADPSLARMNLRGQAVARTVGGRTMEVFALAGPIGRGGEEKP